MRVRPEEALELMACRLRCTLFISILRALRTSVVLSALCLNALVAWSQSSGGASSAKNVANRSYLMFVGTYTKGESKGIYAFRYDATSGRVAALGLAAETDNPSFLAADPGHRFLYAVNELTSYKDAASGAVSAFAIDHLILLFTLAIFTVVGFLAAEIGGGGSRDFLFYQQARIVLPILLPLAIILFITYFAFFHGSWGQTIGKMIFGLRVVTIDGQPLTFPRALVRTIVYALSAIPLFLGFFWVAFTRSKRSWHDFAAGTMVIRE